MKLSDMYVVFSLSEHESRWNFLLSNLCKTKVVSGRWLLLKSVWVTSGIEDIKVE